MINEKSKITKFQLVVNLEAVEGQPSEELARILRYWAGNLKHYSFDEAHTESVMDSAYGEVGHWSLS
ncbi:hypothetical protein ACFQE5_01960 [Pseudonocardia hispaniensis]|uniref:Uncharacterized protein n=1 Tax=Pseudonocardia hispaniensis TaxID=904933 RepID=A0ABW1IWV9_9PSEU